MSFDSVPWFVGGGALHPAEAARLLAYAATSGAAGVVVAGDLAVTQLPTAGTSVRVAVGGAVIPNLYPGGGQQSYVGRAASSTDVSVTATDSGSGRVDLVVARIDDPFYGGTVPADVTVGPYVRIAIIENVTAGSADIPAGLAYPAIALARLDIPASTATITTPMITSLAKVVGAIEVPAPAFAAYTPAWTSSGTNPVLGNGTLVGASKASGNQIAFRATLTLGSTSTIGTGGYSISLPFPAVAVSGIRQYVDVWIFDASVGAMFKAEGLITSGGTVVSLWTVTVGTNGQVSATTGGGPPIVPAVGDTYTVTGVYERA